SPGPATSSVWTREYPTRMIRCIGTKYVIFDKPATTHEARVHLEEVTEAMTTHIAMLLYPGVTQLDLTTPFELFHRLPDTNGHVVGKNTKPVVADSGLGSVPTASVDDVPPADVLVVPGGYGQIDLLGDAEVVGFLRRQGEQAKYVTSVCTGALL